MKWVSMDDGVLTIVRLTHLPWYETAVGEEVTKLMGMGMSEEGYSMVAMDTMPAGQESNGPTGGYSPPSDGEGVGQITSDEEL